MSTIWGRDRQDYFSRPHAGVPPLKRSTWAQRHPVANDLLVTLVLVGAMLFVAWCLSHGSAQ